MNWACLIQAVLAYLACTGGLRDPKAQSKLTDCLIEAATKGLEAAIPAFIACISAQQPPPPPPPGEGYNPGDRIRCPGPACAAPLPTA